MKYRNIYSGRTENYASPLGAYTLANDTIQTVLKKMMEFNVSKIAVCNEKFQVIGGISKNQIRNYLINQEKNTSIKALQKYCAKDIPNDNTSFALAYTGGNITEAIDAMRTLKTNIMPVVKSPWNKELKGFLELERLEAVKVKAQ